MVAGRPDIPQAAYDDAVEAWLSEPGPELRIRLGATLAKDPRSVTPDMFRQLDTLFSSLLSAVTSSGHWQDCKLRSALTQGLQSRTSLIAGWNFEDALSSTVVHVQCCANMLRSFCREHVEGAGSRRFPRSGGFRRRMNLADVTLMDKLRNMIVDSPSAASPLASPRSFSMDSQDCSEAGFPVCFAPKLPKSSIAASSQDAPAIAPRMVDGYPTCFAPPRRASTNVQTPQQTLDFPQCFAPAKSQLPDLHIDPIQPNPKNAEHKQYPRQPRVNH